MIEGWQGWREGGNPAVTHSSRRGGAPTTHKKMLNGEAVEMAGCVDTALMFTFYDHTPKARIYNVKRTFRVVTA